MIIDLGKWLALLRLGNCLTNTSDFTHTRYYLVPNFTLLSVEFSGFDKKPS